MPVVDLRPEAEIGRDRRVRGVALGLGEIDAKALRDGLGRGAFLEEAGYLRLYVYGLSNAEGEMFAVRA